MASTTSDIQIPLFYNIFFTYFDPAVAALSAWADVSFPETILHGVVPNATLVPSHFPIFIQLGGLFLAIAFLQAVLLRYTKDLGVWKIFQAAVLITDVVVLWSLYWSMKQAGKVNPADWEYKYWETAICVSVFVVVRVLFLAGVGLGAKGKGSVKKA